MVVSLPQHGRQNTQTGPGTQGVPGYNVRLLLGHLTPLGLTWQGRDWEVNPYNRSLSALAFWNSRVIIRLLAGTSSYHGKGSEGMWMLGVLLSVTEILSMICPEGQQGGRKALKGFTEFKAQHENHQGAPTGDTPAAQQAHYTCPAVQSHAAGPRTREHPLLESLCTPHASGHL